MESVCLFATEKRLSMYLHKQKNIHPRQLIQAAARRFPSQR